MNESLIDALKSIDVRLRGCFGTPISAEDAYDSFYQEIVAEALAECPDPINYLIVGEFATKHNVSYNELCVMVRAAAAVHPDGGKR